MKRLRALGGRIQERYMRWRWARVVDHAITRALAKRLPDMGAALAYFSILALFPLVIVLVGLLGLFGTEPATTDALLEIVDDLGPDSADETAKGPVEAAISDDTGAGVALGIGLVFALWTASSYVGAFIRAANRIFENEEERPYWKLRPLQLAVTLGTIGLLGLALVALVVTGPLADAIGEQLGIPKATVAIYDLAKWPAVVFLLIAVVGLLYGTSPNVRRIRRRFVSPGCLWSVGIWVIGSAGFTVYVANFSHYNETYGSIAGVVVFILWIWLSNLALLVGLLIDAELERERLEP